ncbi:MAG: class I SAM-dependent methyltransferase [Actinomycetota bacterium]
MSDTRHAIRQALWSVGITPRMVGRLRWMRKMQLLRRYNAPLRRNLAYVLGDPEVDNFTYDLANEDELVVWLSSELGANRGRVAELLVEARSNRELYGRLRDQTQRRISMKTEPAIGRRLGWYVIVRLVKPARIIETGTHDGIGSLVLLSALDRNSAEGNSGELVSIDPDPTSGWIVGERANWSRRTADSRSVLREVLQEAPVQLFLHDSLHTYEHEHFELEAAAAAMESGVLVSDNSHETSALSDVCEKIGVRYSVWRERPRNHFYPGAGIGMAVLRPAD